MTTTTFTITTTTRARRRFDACTRRMAGMKGPRQTAGKKNARVVGCALVPPAAGGVGVGTCARSSGPKRIEIDEDGAALPVHCRPLGHDDPILGRGRRLRWKEPPDSRWSPWTPRTVEEQPEERHGDRR